MGSLSQTFRSNWFLFECRRYPPRKGIEEYFQRFNAEDVKELSTEIDKLLSLKLPGGEEEPEIYLYVGISFQYSWMLFFASTSEFLMFLKDKVIEYLKVPNTTNQ